MLGAVAKEFDALEMAKLWGRLEPANLVANLIPVRVSDGKEVLDLFPANEESLFGSSLSEAKLSASEKPRGLPKGVVIPLMEMPERLEFVKEQATRIVQTLHENISFRAVFRNCTPEETIFFYSLSVRKRELEDVLRLLQCIEEGKEGDFSYYSKVLAGLANVSPTLKASRILSRRFTVKGLHTPEVLLSENLMTCPVVLDYFTEYHLANGHSIFSKKARETLQNTVVDASGAWVRLIRAETNAYSMATRKKAPLPKDGDFRFGVYVSKNAPAVQSKVSFDHRSRILVPEGFETNGLDLVRLVGREVNCEYRAALSTRELLYKCLDGSETGAMLRPLVPLVAKSLNPALMSGLKLLSDLKVLGYGEQTRVEDNEACRAILRFTLCPETAQIEKAPELMRYACLTLEEVLFILHTEDVCLGRVICPDRFPEWPLLDFRAFERNGDKDTDMEPASMTAWEMITSPKRVS